MLYCSGQKMMCCRGWKTPNHKGHIKEAGRSDATPSMVGGVQAPCSNNKESCFYLGRMNENSGGSLQSVSVHILCTETSIQLQVISQMRANFELLQGMSGTPFLNCSRKLRIRRLGTATSDSDVIVTSKSGGLAASFHGINPWVTHCRESSIQVRVAYTF